MFVMMPLQQNTLGEMEFIYRTFGTNILSSNFTKFVNSILVDYDSKRFWLNQPLHTNERNFESDLKGLINLRKVYQNNPLTAYLNINPLFDEKKLDSSFPDHQFKLEGYQFPPLRRGWNSKGGGKMVSVGGFIAKQMKNLETKNAETICLELTIVKNKCCILFDYRPPNIKKNFRMKVK